MAAAHSSDLLLHELRHDASAAATALGCKRTDRRDAEKPARNPDQAGVGGGVAAACAFQTVRGILRSEVTP